MSGRLEGKSALITGGGTGIGAAIAAAFTAEGAKVVITGRREQKLQDRVAEMPAGSATYVVGDVGVIEDSKNMVAKAVEFGGGLDILVNNAGIDAGGLLVDIPLETWTNVINTNLNGPFLMSRHALPYLVEKGKASIVNIASLAGIRNIPGMPAYSASKAGLIGLSSAIAMDYGKYGVRSNIIAPGGVETEMSTQHSPLADKLKELYGDKYATVSDYMTQYLPIPRVGAGNEIAAAAVYFASDESLYTTGTVLPIDGGAAIVDPVSAAIHNISDSGTWS